MRCLGSPQGRFEEVKTLLGEKDSLSQSGARPSRYGLYRWQRAAFRQFVFAAASDYVDQEVLAREYIVFSAGSHYHSIRMRPEDWVKLVMPVIADLWRERQ